MIHYILYVSAAAELLTDTDLKDLLLQSEINNKLYGVTGLLLYHKGSFMQLIEGSKAQIKQLFANIESDPRNNTVIKLVEHETEERTFPDWAMAFKSVTDDDLRDIKAYTSPDNLKLPTGNNNEAVRLLQTFVDSHK